MMAEREKDSDSEEEEEEGKLELTQEGEEDKESEDEDDEEEEEVLPLKRVRRPSQRLLEASGGALPPDSEAESEAESEDESVRPGPPSGQPSQPSPESESGDDELTRAANHNNGNSDNVNLLPSYAPSPLAQLHHRPHQLPPRPPPVGYHPNTGWRELENSVRPYPATNYQHRYPNGFGDYSPEERRRLIELEHARARHRETNFGMLNAAREITRAEAVEDSARAAAQRAAAAAVMGAPAPVPAAAAPTDGAPVAGASAPAAARPPAAAAAARPAAAAKAKENMRFTSEELLTLAEIISDILPIGRIQWELVESRYNQAFPTRQRNLDNLRRQFNRQCKKKAPTGNPHIEEHVRLAKQAQMNIIAKADAVQLGGDDADIDIEEMLNNVA